MGGVCAGGTVERRRQSAIAEHESGSGLSGKLRSMASFGRRDKSDESYKYPSEDVFGKRPSNLYDSVEMHLSISRELKPMTPARTSLKKAPQSSFFGKASIAGLEKAVEVLDTLGSSMANFSSSGFATGVVSRGNKISILAFEVANTIAKGSNLMQSLSEESIQYLKKDILLSERVQRLVSTDMNVLQSIASSDKREEFNVFSREVIRFGNMCRDPQWHNLERYFSKLDSYIGNQQQREEAEMTMLQLTALAQNTSDLYHEFHALDRLEHDHQQKLNEVDSFHLSRKGESLMMLQSEVKLQRKLVKNLKKKSLWNKSLEQVVEKLVDIVSFIHQKISEVFGDTDGSIAATMASFSKPERLGVTGLALHYANVITQIDNIASRPTLLPANMRDTLYSGLPPSVKAAIRSQIQMVDAKEELTIPQIRSEMEKTLQWLVPVAADTTKAHQGFGWVGEWANNGNDSNKQTGAQNSLVRLQTLYHAEKQKVDSCILELVTWLHHLICVVRYKDNGYNPFPSSSPLNKESKIVPRKPNKTPTTKLSTEDVSLLADVIKRTKLLPPGVSKSQEFVTKPTKNKILSSSKSTGSSPQRSFKHHKMDSLDIIDGLNSR